METISIKASLRHGWEAFKHHWKLIFGLGIVTLLVQFFVNAMYELAQGRNLLLTFVLWVLVVLISIIFKVGWGKVYLSMNKGASTTWETFKTKPDLWMRYLKVTIWYVLYSLYYIVLAGSPLILIAIIAGVLGSTGLLNAALVGIAVVAVGVMIYVGVRYQFLIFTVVESALNSSKEVFLASGKITKNHFWKLLALDLVYFGVILLGVICIGIGLIIAIPVVKLGQAYVYRQLSEKTQ